MSLMSCLEKLFTFSNLVPTPVSRSRNCEPTEPADPIPRLAFRDRADSQAVAPAFMLLFGISLFYSVKPCGYCLAIVSWRALLGLYG